MSRVRRTILSFMLMAAGLSIGCEERAGEEREASMSLGAPADIGSSAEALEGTYCIINAKVASGSFHFDGPNWLLDSATGYGPQTLTLTVQHTVWPQIAKAFDLLLGFLHPVLTELPEPGGESLAHGLGGKRLAYGHEGDVLGPASRARRRPGDALPNGGHAVGDHFFAGLSAAKSPLAVATFWALVGFIERYFSRRVTASSVLPSLSAIVARW